MKFGSLFAGIGGIDLGLERAGMEIKWMVEIDPYCQKVLAKHWPEVKRYGDIKECGASNLDPVDLICGGFPCQDISYAGKGAGIEGERSGLWKEFYRIICELRPRYVLVENVPALLRRGLDVVLGDLASCGYDAEWDCLSAAAFGAPHRRDRIFIVAYTDKERLEGSEQQWQQLLQCSRTSDSGKEADISNADKQHDDGSGYGAGKIFGGRSAEASIRSLPEWLPESGVCRVANGVSSPVERLRCLGNAVVPQVAEWIGKKIMTAWLKENEEVTHDFFPSA